MLKMNAGQLRKYQEVGNKKIRAGKNEIYIILDNVLDTYNIGSIFRLADAVGAREVIICGASEIPPNHRIKKASINTTELVKWSYAESAIEAARNLKFKIKNLQLVAVEQNAKSVPYDEYEYSLPIALVVGHESDGVSPEVLKVCDVIVELPMFGVNISLNVMVSLAIVLYKAIEKTK